MEAVCEKKIRPFGAKDKWAYAMGDFGCNMSFALKNYITVFYTLYVGIDPTTMGIIILLLNIWDGINDPIVGALVDRLKPGKHGKFKPWIFWGALALIVSGAMVFLPSPEFTDSKVLKIIICILGYLTWDLAYTVVNVPYGSMASVITANTDERAHLSKYRSIGAMIAGLPVGIIVPMIIYKDRVVNGVKVINPETGKVVQDLIGMNVFIMALILGVVGFFAFMILIKGSIERVQPEVKADDEVKEKVSYIEVIKSFLKNRSAVGLTIASFFQLIMMQGLSTANTVLFKDLFGKADLSGIIQMISYIPMVAAIAFVNPLVKKYGKKKCSTVPLVAGVIGGALMAIIPNDGGTAGLVIWIALQAVVSSSVAILALISWAMIVDCIDYQELNTGRREEGTVYAIYSFGRKFAQGVGAAAVLIIMGWLGFQEAKNGGATPTQADDVVNRIRILVGIVHAVCCLAQFLAMQYIYDLDKKKVEEMQQKLGRVNEVLAPHPED